MDLKLKSFAPGFTVFMALFGCYPVKPTRKKFEFFEVSVSLIFSPEAVHKSPWESFAESWFTNNGEPGR